MKKRLLPVVILSVVLAGSLSLLSNASALGLCGFAVCSNADVNAATYEFVAPDKMQFTADYDGDIVTWTDSQPGMKNHVYKADDPSKFCGSAKIKIFKDEYVANLDPMPALTKIRILDSGKCKNLGAQHVLVAFP
jgi:hypothetical protein